MAKYVMALDQGTTSSRCILFDQKGKREWKQWENMRYARHALLPDDREKSERRHLCKTEQKNRLQRF